MGQLKIGYHYWEASHFKGGVKKKNGAIHGCLLPNKYKRQYCMSNLKNLFTLNSRRFRGVILLCRIVWKDNSRQ